MITIFKNKKDIPSNMNYVELNDVFFILSAIQEYYLFNLASSLSNSSERALGSLANCL